jgi:fructosamine-3-kinase
MLSETQSTKVLLMQAEELLHQLSAEQLQFVIDFLNYLAEKGGIERETEYTKRLAAHERIMQRRRKIQARTETHPDATEMIRQIRES